MKFCYQLLCHWMAGLIICCGCNVWAELGSDHGHVGFSFALPDETLELAG